MSPHEKNDLKAENEALKLAIKESQETMEELRRIFDDLTARNKQLEAAQRLQGIPTSPPMTETVEKQGPTAAPATPAPATPAPLTLVRASHIPLSRLGMFNGVPTSVIQWWITFLTLVNLHGMMEAFTILTLPFYLAGVAHHVNQHAMLTLRTLAQTFYKDFKQTKPVYKEVLRRQQEQCTETSLTIAASDSSITMHPVINSRKLENFLDNFSGDILLDSTKVWRTNMTFGPTSHVRVKEFPRN